MDTKDGPERPLNTARDWLADQDAYLKEEIEKGNVIMFGMMQSVTMQMFLDSRTMIRAPHLESGNPDEGPQIGTMLFGVPILDAGSYDIDLYYRNEIHRFDRAAGQNLTLHRIGDPAQSGRIHQSLRSPDLALQELLQAIRYVDEFYKTGREDWHRLGEMEQAVERFGLSPDDVPSIVFLSSTGERPVGILRLAPSWYDSPRSWEIFSVCFRNWMMRAEIADLVFQDHGDEDRLRQKLRPLTRALTILVDKTIRANRYSPSTGPDKWLILAAPFDTSAGTRWGDVEIRFLNGDIVSIKCPDRNRVLNYTQLGMCDSRNAGPTVHWRLLTTFAAVNGYLGWKDSDAALELKKQKQGLNDRLKALFPKIAGEPIVWDEDTKCYRCRFHIFPEWKTR